MSRRPSRVTKPPKSFIEDDDVSDEGLISSSEPGYVRLG